MKTLGIVIAGAAALAVVAWFAMALATERVVARWLEARAAEGWVVNYADLQTRGFPTRLDTTFQELELADPDTGWVWTAPVFSLSQAVLRPDRITATWPATQALASPVERLDIVAAELSSVLDVQPARRFALDASTTTMRAVTVTSSLGGATTLAEGNWQVTRVVSEEAEYDILFEARGLVPPEAVARVLDPAGVLPEAADLARYAARMRFDRPWDLSAIEDARPQITALALTEMRAQWGPLLLRASGDLTVDPQGRATGQIAVRAENWREMLAMAQRSGAIGQGMATASERALSFVAGLSGRPEDIDATLRLDDGFVFFGPLPVGQAPPLVLR